MKKVFLPLIAALSLIAYPTSLQAQEFESATDAVPLNNVQEQTCDKRIFNMMGQEVGTDINRLSSGLYIQNGKVIYVK